MKFTMHSCRLVNEFQNGLVINISDFFAGPIVTNSSTQNPELRSDKKLQRLLILMKLELKGHARLNTFVLFHLAHALKHRV